MCSATLPTGRRRCTATCDDGRAGRAVERVEGARAVGRAQRGGRRGEFGRGGFGQGRFGRAAKLAALAALAVPLTAGCSVDEVLRFGWPIGVTPQATAMREFWTWSARRRTGGRGDRLGRDVLGDDLPPQACGRVGRAAAPDAVQPAHRDHLHRGADGHRGGAVRLHGAGAERRPGPGGGPGPEGGRRRVPVELAVHLPGRHHHDGGPGHHDRHPRHDPAAGAAHQPVDPVHPASATM